MKRFFFFIALIFLLSSCPVEGYEKIDALLENDRKPPVLLSWDIRDNRHLSLLFDEPVTLTELTVGGLFVPRNRERAESHLLTLIAPLESGREEVMKMTAEDGKGNTSRWWTHITGVNLFLPDCLITEVSPDGTRTSPDRIEITFLEDGSTEGLCLTDATLGKESHRWYFPSVEVKRNDIAVIYWDREPEKLSSFDRDFNRTHVFYAGSPVTLSSTNGSVVLWAHTNGKGLVMDACLWNKSGNTLSEGFGNDKSLKTFRAMEEKGEWRGETVNSDEITSSRVISRWYPYEDNGIRSDWYISAPRESSFGWPNRNMDYLPAEKTKRP